MTLPLLLALGAAMAPAVSGGCHPVGTRTAIFRDARRRRELPVTLWYPAGAKAGTPAPYMDPPTAQAVAGALHLLPGFERDVRTHALSEAPLAPGGAFPVVLLEHGSRAVPSLYSILAEALAGGGFVVAAPNHPGESLAAFFPDAPEARFAPSWPIAAPPALQAMAMGKYARRVLLPDVRLVLDRLGEMNRSDPFWRGRLDLSRVGIVGHSMGGAVAALAAHEDARIAAAANLDGPAFPGMAEPGRPYEVGKPLLYLLTPAHASSRTGGREYAGSAGATYYVEVPGAGHTSFSDAALLRALFSLDPPPGGAAALARARLTLTLADSLVAEFFRKYLCGEEAPHLDLAPSVERK